MLIYQPTSCSCDRVVWHGGYSTQLFYEQEAVGPGGQQIWVEKEVRTLGRGIPTETARLHDELTKFYDYCQTRREE